MPRLKAPTTTGALLSDTVTFPGTLPASLDDTVKKIGYTYDDFGRKTKVTSYSDTGSTVANEVAFEYGPWGAVTKSMQDHAAAATDTDPNVEYAYEDGIDGVEAKFVRPDYVTYPGPSTRRVVYYNYATSGVGAALSRLGEIADNHGDQGGRTRYASYMYLGAGTMVDANYPAVTGIPALTYGSRVNSYSGFDRFGRVVDQKWQNQSGTPTVNDRFKYAYDRASNRTSRDPAADSHTPPDANDNYYTYDGLDRLVQSNWGTLDVNGVITDQNADANQAWTLDPVGNWSQFKWDADGGADDWTTQSRAHNKANEIEGNGGNPISGNNADWVDPTYDLAGNMISGPQPRYETADANTQWYKYDAWNRLVEVSQGASSPGTLVAQYRYDGLNRRIRKYVTSDYVIAYCGQDVLCGPGLLRTPQPSSYWNVTEYYYNESWQVLETREALEVGRWYEPLSEPGVSAATREQYVWGANYIDAPVVRFRDGNLDGDVADVGTDSTLYYTYDGNFNVTALVKTDGTVAERYTYDPYGKVAFKNASWTDAASQAKSAYDNEILYCGYRWDPESGNYQVRNRYLTPPLGRWTTTDPIGYGDGMNRYQYVGGQPGGNADPQGTVIVTLTGLNMGIWGGKSDDLDAASRAIQIKLSWLLLQYQEKVNGPIAAVVFNSAKKAGGGPTYPGWIRGEYAKFIKRKEEDVCSLEQFIVIGHSDGATGIRLASPDLNDKRWPPAYYGLVDLVREGLILLVGNDDRNATTDITANAGTYVQNFRQTNSIGLKGRFVPQAHDNVDVSADKLVGEDGKEKDVSHFTIPRDPKVISMMAERATKVYIERVNKDIQSGRPRIWRYRPGFNVSW